MTTPARSGGGAPDPGLAAIMDERRRLINLAYPLLGSLAKAEDAVQEAYALHGSARASWSARSTASPAWWPSKTASS